MKRQRANLGQKQNTKGALKAEVSGKKSELAAKNAQKLAREAQLQTIEDQRADNKQALKSVERRIHETGNKIQQQTALQQETHRLRDQVEAQLRGTERDLECLNQQLNDKQVI
jgi:chromosome segregation ATPase